ncbi:class I adenylate-forming enzyme family protein [Raoultella terrigena]|uniref:class I adenylate-forming enzyme family protein n=1 Tax=Raoultella terrigena TaxID=577 RepID=UPI002F92D282
MSSTSADFHNLYQALRHSASRRPDALALAFEDQRYRYRDFHQRVQQTMTQLDRVWSLRKGDRILLAWGNHPAFCEIFFAALGLGIEVIPFSTKLKQAESEELVGHIAPQAVLFDASLQDWLGHTANARCVALTDWQALTLPEALPDLPVQVTRDDTAIMMFTSGTTGEPKGAIITHGNLLCAIDAYAQKLNLTEADSTILAVPIYHITGLSALLALFITLGASIWLQQRFNAPEVLNTLREQNITFLHGSPTVFILLCQAARARNALQPTTWPSLRAIACGAGHLNEGLIGELKMLFPNTAIHPIYGLTETTSPATIFPVDVWDNEKRGSSGQAIPGLAIRILDDRQQSLPSRQIGHIWLKGDVVIREYWQRSERRPSCDAQGWFCTGDLGYLDEEGWLYIKDRSKDMINRGGEKIYSLELENIISTHQGVREVAVIPAPSPVYGEEPVAFIVPDAQYHLTSEEILAWLRVKVARFKLPARIIFTRTLPRTHNGKVSKRQLKTRLAESITRLTTEEKK